MEKASQVRTLNLTYILLLRPRYFDIHFQTPVVLLLRNPFIRFAVFFFALSPFEKNVNVTIYWMMLISLCPRSCDERKKIVITSCSREGE